jgi:thiol:disulfide interchange protein DsbG
MFPIQDAAPIRTPGWAREPRIRLFARRIESMSGQQSRMHHFRPRNRRIEALAGFALVALLITNAHARGMGWQRSGTLLYQHISGLHWVAAGHGPKVLYDFIDPNSRPNHALFEQLAPLIRRDQLTIRQILVAYLSPTSTGKAAAILQSGQPMRVLDEGEARFAHATGAGITPVPVQPRTQHILRQDFQALTAVEGNPWMRFAPILIYRAKDGRVHVFQRRLTNARLATIIASVGRGS